MAGDVHEWQHYFTLMAQRDDAVGVAEQSYWRGYIDAVADHEGLTDRLGEIEAAYQAVQAWAAESMDAHAAAAENGGRLDRARDVRGR